MRFNFGQRRQGPDSQASSDTKNESPNGENKRSDDQEKQDEKPQPVGFFHHSLKHVRHEAVGKWILTTAILMAFILGCLSIYWAVFYNVNQNITSLVIYVVDFDGRVAPYDNVNPLVGPLISGLAMQMVNSAKPHLGYTVVDPSEFNNDPIQVRQAVYDWKAWAAIIINANATSLLQSAVQNGNVSYDPLGACQLVYTDSRDDTNWYDFISPQITQFQTQATSLVGETFAGQVMRNASTDTNLLTNAARVPQALSPAIGFSMYNLRPFFPYTAIPAVSIGLIYLIIVSFFSFSFYLPIHQKYLKPEGHPPLKFWQLVIWRWFATISAYFMLSLSYSFISLALQINFKPSAYTPQTEVYQITDSRPNPGGWGNGTFPLYWMLNFFGMIALGLSCENVAMLIGQPWTAMWLIFWVITNVSTAFYNIDIEPGFYQWGYAWPLHYVVEGSRQILFDLHNTLPLDFGVLIAWGAVNTLLFPFACYFMRWKSQHGVHEYYK
ncbi:hypothetical protein AMS68_004872 [Peltaster fructicola]|uniref:DUF3533 domain-containing protein n=1 Tax=Peltaster fructicola TaxID=286661 RepID=A0A6H0XXG9_9PEZI|nr:hypothetical protein AMS68_004872 [Peltaster fructicola]